MTWGCMKDVNFIIYLRQSIVSRRNFAALVTDEQLLQMKEAIEDHRASNKQAPRTIYGMIVAEADRIIDPEVTLRRTVQYGCLIIRRWIKKSNMPVFGNI